LTGAIKKYILSTMKYYHSTTNPRLIQLDGFLRYGTMTSDYDDMLHYAEQIKRTGSTVYLITIDLPVEQFRIQIGEEYPDGISLDTATIEKLF
jgi:hypothetical protein